MNILEIGASILVEARRTGHCLSEKILQVPSYLPFFTSTYKMPVQVGKGTST